MLKQIKWRLYLIYASIKESFYPSVLTKVKYRGVKFDIIPDGTFTPNNVSLRLMGKYKNPDYKNPDAKYLSETKYLNCILLELRNIDPNECKFLMNPISFIRNVKFYYKFYRLYWLDIWIRLDKIPNNCPLLPNNSLKLVKNKKK